MLKQVVFIASIIVLLFSACGENGDDTPPVGVYDRGAMLKHYADNIIIPSYDELHTAAQNLETAITQLLANPTVTSLDNARSRYQLALIAWQSANAFNFGPAGEEGLNKSLVEEIGTFPISTEKVINFIATGDTSLNNFDRDSRGFYTLGYLLYDVPGLGSDILFFLQDADYQSYMRVVVRDIVDRIEAVQAAWANGYADDFTSRIGTDVGSGTSQLYNEFVKSFEAIKNFKTGLPAGKRPGQTGPQPELVESRFAQISKELMAIHLASIFRIYQGDTPNGSNGPSLMDYVEAVEGGPALANATRLQWATVFASFSTLPVDKTLQELAAEESPELDAFHTEIQKHTRFFKSDMSSVLGIAITFASGDGD